MSGVDEPPELPSNRHWRIAVWSLRVGYVGLAIAVAGLVLVLSGLTPWVLAFGVLTWLVAAVVTYAEFFWARPQLPEPRPGYWSMRWMLIHDSIHTRTSALRS